MAGSADGAFANDAGAGIAGDRPAAGAVAERLPGPSAGSSCVSEVASTVMSSGDAGSEVNTGPVSSNSAVGDSPRRRILGKTPSCGVAFSADSVCGDSIMAPGVSAASEDLFEPSGLIMPSRLLRRSTSDLPDGVLEALLTAAMEEPSSDEALTAETACDHSVAMGVSTVSLASEPPAAVSAD